MKDFTWISYYAVRVDSIAAGDTVWLIECDRQEQILETQTWELSERLWSLVLHHCLPWIMGVIPISTTILRGYRPRGTRLRGYSLRSYRLRSYRLRSYRLRGYRLRGYRLRGYRLRGYSLRSYRLRSYRLRGYSLRSYRLRGFRLRGYSLRGYSLRSYRLRSYRLRGYRMRSYSLIGTVHWLFHEEQTHPITLHDLKFIMGQLPQLWYI